MWLMKEKEKHLYHGNKKNSLTLSFDTRHVANFEISFCKTEDSSLNPEDLYVTFKPQFQCKVHERGQIVLCVKCKDFISVFYVWLH